MPTHPEPTPDASQGTPLPRFDAPSSRDQAVLAASQAVVALLLQHGRSDFTIRELAEHAGVSERTFYRYFPRKEDAVRPYLTAGLDHVVARVDALCGEGSLTDAVRQAHAEVLGLVHAQDAAVLLDVLTGTERLRAVWIQVSVDAEAALGAVIAARWGVPADSHAVALAAATVVAAGRLALQGAAGSGQEPLTVFEACLARMGSVLTAPA
ncbi:MAG: helix-turn-helix transcriptional regulator [Alphaproteobacteria bacterium]|nr:helix-turn-helix transcriptional regulator [Alphaproteobacteria bacterium]